MKLVLSLDDRMLIGIIGAPNKGKSTLFSAMTMVDADIADYAFTTIKPNMGVAYASKECVEKELNTKCNPRNSLCTNGMRQLPVNIIDVAGLVPGAHLGKGMGNQFLNDLINADALIQVVDLSGKTDVNGKSAEYSDPAEEVEMIAKEMSEWLAEIITKHMDNLSRRADGDKALAELLSGFKVNEDSLRSAANATHMVLSHIKWTRNEVLKFSGALLKINKPIIIAANKYDKSTEKEFDEMRKKLPDYTIIPCSGAIELALRKAAKNGMINYQTTSKSFDTIKSGTKDQEAGLSYMKKYLKERDGTGVQELLNTIVYKVLNNIVAYPVEDENKYTDHFGKILPDAILIKDGSTAVDLAARIHSDLAEGMKYAVDAKRKTRVAKEYLLKDNDVIKIVSSIK